MISDHRQHRLLPLLPVRGDRTTCAHPSNPARHLPSTRTRLCPQTRGLDPTWVPTCRTPISSAGETHPLRLPFSIQQVLAQLGPTATNRPARGCAALRCGAVLCRNPHEVPALRAAAQETTPAGGARCASYQNLPGRGMQQHQHHREHKTDGRTTRRPNSKLYAQHFFVDSATLTTAFLLQSLPLSPSHCDQRPSSTPRGHNSTFACDTA